MTNAHPEYSRRVAAEVTDVLQVHLLIPGNSFAVLLTGHTPTVTGASAVWEDESVRHTILKSPVGALTIVAQAEALTALLWEGQQPKASHPVVGERVRLESDSFLGAVAQEISEYFSATRHSFSFPVELPEESFNREVWEHLQTIPFGSTTSYGTIASACGYGPGYAQRVGQAVGANPLGLVIPCHRVLASDGSLRGFAGGLSVKKWLLIHEGVLSPDPTLF